MRETGRKEKETEKQGRIEAKQGETMKETRRNSEQKARQN